MEIDDITGTMKARMPWDTARRVFDIGGIEKAHGWDNTVRKLNTADVDDEGIEYLSNAVKEHILCGEKLSRFYHLTKKEVIELRKAVLELKPTSSDFRRVYPASLSEAKIEETFPQKPTLVAVETNEDGIGVVFASTRAVEVRQQIEIDGGLPEGAAELLEGYDEVFGIKLAKFQAMDVVWIPHNGQFVDVRIDFPKGMHRDTGNAAQEVIKDAFAKLVKKDGSIEPINLFPLIGKIYDAPNEGHVVELAFGTTTASLKHEKMRRSSTCLRKEKYHRGGKQALNTPIEPYRLSVRWVIPMGHDIISNPELSLQGTSRMAGSALPTLYEATIRGCVGVADYEHVRERIEYYLKT